MNVMDGIGSVAHRRGGYSLIGMLITMACIVVLMVISLTALNNAVTGGGETKSGTVHSVQDTMQLTGIYQGLFLHGNSVGGRFPTPSIISGKDHSVDTTANLYSAMIAARLVQPETLVSPNEHSGWVEADRDYDYNAYDPAAGVYWDPSFKADLEDISNVSYAHLPLHGERYERNWKIDAAPVFPILGTRGPKDGIEDPTSLTYSREGTWAGHLVFGDGSVDFVSTFTPGNLTIEIDGSPVPDSVYSMQAGPDGADAIIAFTRAMTEDGPELQFD